MVLISPPHVIVLDQRFFQGFDHGQRLRLNLTKPSTKVPVAISDNPGDGGTIPVMSSIGVDFQGTGELKNINVLYTISLKA
ncbi:hypothetical protein NL676_012370 [Syzygium grande]|nr:hypothetical protein NL676_012370 [Syzygium grande]